MTRARAAVGERHAFIVDLASQGLTLTEIGLLLNPPVTRERARQLLQEAGANIKALRPPPPERVRAHCAECGDEIRLQNKGGTYFCGKDKCQKAYRRNKYASNAWVREKSSWDMARINWQKRRPGQPLPDYLQTYTARRTKYCEACGLPLQRAFRNPDYQASRKMCRRTECLRARGIIKDPVEHNCVHCGALLSNRNPDARYCRKKECRTAYGREYLARKATKNV